MACQRCHRKKVKCSGGDNVRNISCHSCRAAGAPCVYPTRERNVSVSETYLRALESVAVQFNGSPQAGRLVDIDTSSTATVRPRPSKRRFIENTTADAFVSKFRKLGTSRANQSSTEGDNIIEQARIESTAQHKVPSYEYFHLSSDSQASNVTLKLPPYPYAIHLVDQFEAYMGYEYHWYLRKSFRERLESTYTNPLSEASKDRTWLCRLLVVLALGETYNSRVAPEIQLYDDHHCRSVPAMSPPPGVAFFEQAMSLFKTPCEDANIDHVEALNLIAFYSYSLDRRRSAYIYAGLAMRIASSLMLHNHTCSTSTSRLDSEHCRRLWWTTYQLDAMTGSEMGINSTFDFEEIEAKSGVPTDDGLTSEELKEFASCAIFTAHIRLCSVRAGILSVASAGSSEVGLEQIRANLEPTISLLEEWRSQLPEEIGCDFSRGISPAVVAMPECRSVASLYLRFNQCFILLVRPLVLRYLGSAVTGDFESIDDGVLILLCNRCVDSARHNLNILTGLWQIDKIAKFGFWESLHLFSSIKMFLMASIINAARPFHIVYKNPDDDILYQDSKLLLHEMANVGNMASRGHLNLLEELECTRELILERVRADTSHGLVLPGLDADIDHWLAMLSSTPNNGDLPV